MVLTQQGDEVDEEALPPYQHSVSESQPYRPPPGPPPEATISTSSELSSLPHNKDFPAAPPSLGEAPPTYEPFSFSTAFARSHHANAPKWHSPPTYNVYHDPNGASITFHMALPATEPPCACSSEIHCTCHRRRPAIWQASSSTPLQRSSKMSIELRRISPFSGSRQVAFVASNDSVMGSASSLSIRDERQKNCWTRIKKKGSTWSYKDLEGKMVSWTRYSNRLELKNEQGLPMAILHTTTPARLELTAFAWGRMPSDEIECDFPACSLQPLFGFVFRCRDCTEEGEDSYDICEPHLYTECRDHNQSHRFVRQPRPFADFDDCVQETPLLQAKDLEEERRSHELVIMSLACVLLDSRA